jgi:fucose 4-O-acetylase-like acetyltransferase
VPDNHAKDQAAPGESIDWILIAKGIGIVLVVVGHFYPHPSPLYWSQSRTIIYLFHMPLFFMLSGYLYRPGKYPYGALIKNKVRRLLYPFAVIAIGFCLIKLVAGRFVKLEEPVDLNSLVAVIVDPANSYAPLLWFLQALFLIFCIYPLARRFLSDFAILSLFVLLNSIVGSRYPLLGRVVFNMPFFAFGVMLRDSLYLPRLVGGSWRYLAASLGAFAVGCAVQMSTNIFAPRFYVVQFLIGLAGALLVIDISRALADHAQRWRRSVLLRIGYYSMTIYFFHSIFESGARIAIMSIAGAHIAFLAVAFISVTAGIATPVAIEKYLLRPSPIGRRYILGLSEPQI